MNYKEINNQTNENQVSQKCKYCEKELNKLTLEAKGREKIIDFCPNCSKASLPIKPEREIRIFHEFRGTILSKTSQGVRRGDHKGEIYHTLHLEKETGELEGKNVYVFRGHVKKEVI